MGQPVETGSRYGGPRRLRQGKDGGGGGLLGGGHRGVQRGEFLLLAAGHRVVPDVLGQPFGPVVGGVGDDRARETAAGAAVAISQPDAGS
ncbi:hypothetical protein AB0909_29040 [Streptomyces albidoflavus]|uniref:hypothetical protein n=1 Tax=Streptomyces albidoflavus TaxID=1886 RepID=UPI0034562963